MEYIYTFKMRTHAMAFYDRLRYAGIPAVIISTPKEAMVGCGLSVKVSYSFYELADEKLTYELQSGLIAVFSAEYYNGRRVFNRIR